MVTGSAELDRRPPSGVFNEVSFSSDRVSVIVGGGIREAPVPLMVASLFFIVCGLIMANWPRHALVAFPLLSLAGALFVLKALVQSARRVAFHLELDCLEVSNRYAWFPLETERERFEPLDDVCLAKIAPGGDWLPLSLAEGERLAMAGASPRVRGIVVSCRGRSKWLRLPLTFDETLWLVKVLKSGVSSRG